MAAEDILLEGSHADIAMWPSSRGEVPAPAPLLPDDSFGDTAVEYRLGEEARDVSFGDTAVEYLLAEAAEEDLCFGAGSETRCGVMCVMVSFCSNGLATVKVQRREAPAVQNSVVVLHCRYVLECC